MSVPLAAEALALLGPRGQPDDLIFAGPNGKKLLGTAMIDYVRDRGYTVHGFRSTLRRLGCRERLSERAARAGSRPCRRRPASSAPIGAPAWSISAGR